MATLWFMTGEGYRDQLVPCEHLEVAVLPFAKRDRLADLERQVLAKLDPPLNLEEWP